VSTVAISGIEMTTAVGPDARSSAAAFRAGIIRARALEHFTALDDEETDVGPICGHVAAPNALYTEGLGKIVALGAGALRALFESTGPPDRRRTGFYVALPNHSLREETFADVDALVATGARPAPPSTDDDDVPRSIVFAEQCRDHLINRLTRAANVTFAPADHSINFGDNSAFLRALDKAYLALTSGYVQRCIVGGIDSYVDGPSLEWGMAARRMKSDTNPTGFSPGEAAVFIELTMQPSGERPIQAHLSRPGFGDEPGQLGAAEAEPPRGLGIAQAIREAITHARRPVGLVIADLNGDATRAMDWGWALVRSAAEHPVLRDAPVWTPAASFGETGCASAGLAIGVAVEALDRRYARTDSILIVSTSATGDRGAVVVSASPG
jgi:3-oxoacyl-[acyl-carrier-protein] synthase I